MTTIIAAPFNWNVVIDNIVALQNTGVLAGSGIRIVNATPDAADEAPLPILFPSDDPGVTVNTWLKASMINHQTKQFRSRADYTFHFVYLHVEIPQGISNFKKAPYRPLIREAVGKIFGLITANSSHLGVEFVKPLVGSFDFNMTSPATGKKYLGATFSVEVFEFADQTAA